MEGLKFNISAKSFYQTNSEQAYELYKIAREYAQLKETDIVYDLYTGTGTIANFVARSCKKVVGIEYVEAAVKDAFKNSEINGIKNTFFTAGNMKDVFTFEFVNTHGNPDVIITDPPRAGMDPEVVNVILHLKPKRIVYVSCNPSTQARDMALMEGLYRIDKVQAVDMFPQTAHVESVVLLTLK
jgi:23S rRNA (uracil1939-C5)-methyltransferase